MFYCVRVHKIELDLADPGETVVGEIMCFGHDRQDVLSHVNQFNTGFALLDMGEMGRQPRFRLAEGYAPESEKLFLQKHLSAWPQPEARLAEQPASPHVEVLGISRERRLQADLIGRRILIEEVRDAGPGAGPNRVTTRRLDLDSFEASQIAFLLGGRLDGMMPESSRITHTGMRRVVVRASDSPPGSACLWLAESENNVYSMGEGVQITLRPDELRVAADALRRLSDAARDAQKA